MRSLVNLGALIGGVCGSLLVVLTVCAAEPGTSSHEATWEELRAMCDAAKSDFHPLRRADLEPLAAELKQSAGRLDAWLKVAGPHAAGWRKFLKWDKLQQQLRGPAPPDADVLWSIYQQYASGDEGLGLVWFVDVKRALLSYVEAARTIDNPEIKPGYENQLTQLAVWLKDYREKPSPERAWAIGNAVHWLRGSRQAPQLVAALERRFGRPNLWAEISAEAVNAGLSEAVDECTPIEDCILGTAVYGTGHTTGQTRSVLIEDEDYGVVDALLLSKTYTSTVGYHGPVCIYATGLTRIGAVKRMWINQHGVFEHPARSKAVTCTSINDIQARRRLIERMAWRKAMKQLGTAEWIASRHAECRVNRRIDDQADENLAQANEKFRQKFRRPLVEHKLFPEVFHVSSDSRAIRLKSLLRGALLLAAVQPPPEAVKADLVLRIHESLINNFAQDALGGMTVHEERFRKAIIDLFGELPQKMKVEKDEEPWAVTFAKDLPIYVRFDKNRFSITIRGEKYQSGQNAIKTMVVTAHYTIQPTENGFEAVRDEELEIAPKEYAVRGGIPRSVFVNRFEKIFERKIVGEGFMLKDRWEKVGRFVPVQFTSRDGWLVLAWNRVPPPKSETPAKAPPPDLAKR
ncbi:MAG: hypothetical protein JXB10_05930 [Pirellulales bacterium]|nr:hypothetical protein [Pirellulales bacterium]